MNNFKKLWLAYSEFKQLSTVTRAGFGLYGIYPYSVENPFSIAHPESDLEHTAGLIKLIRLISIYFPEVISEKQLDDYLFGAELHEMGELVIGDIPDDGSRNESEKDKNERAAMSKYLSLLPASQSSRGYRLFDEFQTRATTYGATLYCLDKTEAILQGLVYEDIGHPGLLKNKKDPSSADLAAKELLKTDSLVDIWAYGFYKKAIRAPYINFFAELIANSVEVVRGERFYWPLSALKSIENLSFSINTIHG